MAADPQTQMPRPRRAALTMAMVPAVVAAGGGLWFGFGSADDAPPPPERPTAMVTTTSTTSTTVAPIAVDPSITDVATAAIPLVVVLSDPPEGAVLDPRATAAGEALRSVIAAYSPERPGAPAIPTPSAPVQGRRRIDPGWEFDNPTPFGNPLTFIVTEDHGEWLRVMMPIRPNGTQGWIRSADVSRTTITTRIEVDLSDRRLLAWDGARQIADTPVVIGSDDRPTPAGRLYVTDHEEKYRGSAYGPWVLALNGYSQQLDEFSGGVPVIALHGTNNPTLLGTARSNGCVRLPDDVIEKLRWDMPLGTPVDIHD